MQNSEQHAHSIDSVGTYTLIFAVLIVLTFVTTGIAYIDLGVFSVVVALGIACVKMLLVALWFMHVRHSTRLTQMVCAAALVWLAILIVFTLGDVFTRGWTGMPGK